MKEGPEDFLKRTGFTELPWGEINDDIPWFDDDEKAPRPVLETLDVGDDDQPIPPRQWLLGNTFCRGFVSGLIAPGAGCKTSLRIVQPLSVASGRSLTGERVFVRAKTLIVCLEDGMTELRRRLRAATKHHGIGREQVKEWLVDFH